MVTGRESRGRWKFGCRSGARKRKLGHETESKTRGGWGKAAEEEKGGGRTRLERFTAGTSLPLRGAPNAWGL